MDIRAGRRAITMGAYMTMLKGSNAPVPTGALRVESGRSSGPGVPDVHVFLLPLVAGRVRSDADVVRRDGLAHPSGAVRHERGENSGGQAADTFLVDLARVEGAVERLVLVASADGGTFGQVPGLYVEVRDGSPSAGDVVARFDGIGATVERSLVLGEFYRRQGGWRFRAVGQGYGSGIEALAREFGVSPERLRDPRPPVSPPPPPAPPVAAQTSPAPPVSAPTPPSPPPSPNSPPSPSPSPLPSGSSAVPSGPPPAPSAPVPTPGAPVRPPTTPLAPPPAGPPVPLPPPSGAPVRLGKVTLTKAAPSVSLAKQGGTTGALRVNLNWQTRERFTGWGGRKRAAHPAPGLDLDLCALYELTDGRKGVVQALGNAFGSLHRPPYIQLDGDDRTGAVASGENLTVNLDHSDRLRRILVFVTVYEGADSFADLHATVTLRPQHGAPVDFSLDECTVASTVCALALITNTGGDLVVRREARYLVPDRGVSPQRTVDRAYGWGLDWRPGRK